MTLSICITNQGSLIPGPTVSFYSDVDQYTAPIIENVPWADVLNCPYLLINVPDNTQNIKIVDPSSNCCTVIPVTSLNLCSDCNFTFDSINTTTVGLINAGNLTSTCQGPITDYVIQWYGPDSTTNVAFTTGAGSVFSNQYNQTHPLVGNSQIIAGPGVYIPQIYKVVIDGEIYSQDGSVGTQTDINCLNYQVTVQTLNCNNGTNQNLQYLQYSHEFIYNSQGGGLTQSNLTTTLEIDDTINYIAYRFYGGTQYPDTLKIKFHGQLYTQPYIIEYITCGGGSGLIWEDNVFPKLSSLEVKKVLNLSNFNRTPNDYITIEIIPNTQSTNTSWELYLKCLSSFDCTTCDETNHAKLVSSSITTQVPGCGRIDVAYTLVGLCDTNILLTTDVGKYFFNSQGNIFYFSTSPGGTFAASTQPSLGQNFCTQVNYNTTTMSCQSPQSGLVYIYEKQLNESFTIKSSTLAGRDFYLNAYNNIISSQFTTTYPPDDIRYYRGIVLSVPINSNYEDVPCGDQGFNSERIFIHPPTISVESGFDGTYYYLRFTRTTTITNQTSFGECDLYCIGGIDSFVINTNNLSFNPSVSYSYTNTYGSRYISPFAVNSPQYYQSTDITPYPFAVSSSYINEFVKTVVCTEDFVIDQNLSTSLICPFNNYTCTDYGIYNSCQKYYCYFRIEPRNPANPDYPDDFIIKVPPNQVPVDNQYWYDFSSYTIGYQKWNGVVSVLNNFWFT